MEIEEALERLRQYQSEIPRLKTLDYDNPEWPILENRINVVLKVAFKAHSEEWNWVNPHLRPGRGVTTEAEQSGYLWDLENCELGITKILDKYEIIGIPARAETGQDQRAKVSISVYEATNPLYWIARLWRWQPIAVSVRWIKTLRGEVKMIMGLVFLLAAILAILEYFS